MISYNFQNLNVLCVDDDQHMHLIVKTILNAMRIKNIRFCTDAEDAFDLIKHTLPDIVVTDLEMEPVGGPARISHPGWGFRCDPAVRPGRRSATSDAGPSVERFDAPGGRRIATLRAAASAAKTPARVRNAG